MSQERRGRRSRRPVVEEPKKASPELKEATTGILRLDFGKPRRSSGGSVDFRGVPDRLGAQGEPPSPQPSIDRLSVTFAERSDCSESSVKVNIFDPGSPPSQVQQEMDKVRFSREQTVTDGEDEEDDDYSASVSAIMQRRESTRRTSSRKKKRRPSSPFSGGDGDIGLYENRRRSSVFTNSSGETAISIEDGNTQEQIFENIRLHKEVLSNVKLQPWGMRRKLKLVQQAKAYVKRHEGELQERLAMSKSTKDILARFNIWLVKKLQFLRRELANTMTLLIPWELRIKEIESHFGSAVASYFTFLRWMFWVNFVITVVLTCFVAVPELLTADWATAGERKEMLEEEKGSAMNLVTLWDFEGILKYSPIFYGFYTDKDRPGSAYRLPFAYFLTGLAVYVYSFVATLRRMAENSRMSKLSEKDDECVFTWKIFTGWDYMIGNAETAHNRVASLILGFKEALLEESEKKKDEKNWKIISLRVFVNFLVICLLAISAYIVFIVVERSTRLDAEETWWRQNEITVSLSIISIIFPIFFELLGMMEGYHPRKCLRVQLARIMVLNLLNLYTLIFSLFWKISKMVVELESLKPNHSQPETITTAATIYTSVVMVTGAADSPTALCYNVSVECSSIESSSVTSTVTAAVKNFTLISVFLTTNFSGVENNTLTNINESFSTFSKGFNDSFFTTDLSVTDLGNLSYVSEALLSNDSDLFLDDTLSSLDLETTVASVSTEPTQSKKTSSTLSYLFASIADAFMPIIANITRARTKATTTSISEQVDNLNGTNAREQNDTSNEIYESLFEFEGNDTSPGNLTTTADGSEVSVATKMCYRLQCDEPLTTEEPTTITTLAPVQTTLYDMETKRKLRRLCWETMFGQELVKLTVMDLVLTIASILLLDFFRAVFVRVMNNCWCWDLEKKFPQYGDFKIAENILHLVNNQGMVWMGMFFSPGLPAINLVKLAIMMYLRSWAVLTCNVPHEVVFRASRSNNFYLALLLTMLFLCVLPVGYAIVWIKPSWHCGPFSAYERIYHFFTKNLQKALPEDMHKALDYIASPGIIIPLLMLLVLIIYYLVSLTNSLREANNDLKIQLRRERTEERRKMFQMVDKRARKGSKDSETPFAKWKKLLPDLSPKPATPLGDMEKADRVENGIVSGDSRKDINRKELLSRLMKKALRKSSGTSDDDSQIPDDGTDGEQADSLFDEKVTKGKSEAKKQPEVTAKARTEVHPTKKVAKQQHRTPHHHNQVDKERRKSPSSAHSTQRNSLNSDWSENIPVIKISKTESDECILKDDTAKNGKKVTKGTGEGKQRFKETVEKQIEKQRKEKEKLSKKLDKKASDMQRAEKPESKGDGKKEVKVPKPTQDKQEEEKQKKDKKIKTADGTKGKEETREKDLPTEEKGKESSKNKMQENKKRTYSRENEADGGNGVKKIGQDQKTVEHEVENEKKEEKTCPIATEETVSSDLDLSLVSLKADENAGVS